MAQSSIQKISVGLLVALLAIGIFKYREHREDLAMHTMPAGLYEFKVTDPPPICGRWREHMPRHRDPEAYRLYINARNFWRGKIEFQFSRAELQGILTEVMRAAEKGDWGAKALLSHFYLHGLGHLDKNKVLDPIPEKGVQIARQAVSAGQAWGYYDLGVAHEYGYGGAAMDYRIAWAYFRRAAELGSPDAQMALAEAYDEAKQTDTATALRMCAYRQEHGPAATFLGMIAELDGDIAQALTYYQNGTRFGHDESASSLWLFFDVDVWNRLSQEKQGRLRKAGFLPDVERSRRYHMITEALKLNPDLRPTRLDQFVPLPPAALPEWHGVADTLPPEDKSPPTY